MAERDTIQIGDLIIPIDDKTVVTLTKAAGFGQKPQRVELSLGNVWRVFWTWWHRSMR